MKTILRNLGRPILERVGTMIAAYLIARGVESDQAALLVNSLMAACFVVFDMLTSAVNRQRDETRLYAEIYDRMTKEAA
jgi:hypothetical protein